MGGGGGGGGGSMTSRGGAGWGERSRSAERTLYSTRLLCQMVICDGKNQEIFGVRRKPIDSVSALKICYAAIVFRHLTQRTCRVQKSAAINWTED